MKRKGDQFSVLPPQADHAGPVQLPMFMEANNLLDSLTLTADNPSMSKDMVMDIKLHEAKSGGANSAHLTQRPGEPNFHDSVGAEGVKEPVQVIHTDNNIMMGQGHHRVASASEHSAMTGSPQFVPVVHTDARSGTKFEGADSMHTGGPGYALGDHKEFEKNTGLYYEKLSRGL
jgi:hypothetical protein